MSLTTAAIHAPIVLLTVIMPSDVNSKPVWLIVGGSRGIGLEFVRQVTHCSLPQSSLLHTEVMVSRYDNQAVACRVSTAVCSRTVTSALVRVLHDAELRTSSSFHDWLTCQAAATGAHVIATARDLKKAPGLQSLLHTHGEDSAVQVVTLDVENAASVKVRPAAQAWAFMHVNRVF